MDEVKGKFITRICGSEDLYYNRSPLASINFVTAHDGFSLCDLVSYNEKHNLENGEKNHDGMNRNCSWNCGIEGRTDDPSILELRQRQMRNFFVVLLVSQGVPMLLMGDEYGHTKKGNNNAWCHDDERNWFLWDQLKDNAPFFRFCKLMIQFRKNNPLLRRTAFLKKLDAEWHGIQPLDPHWGDQNGFIAFTLLDPILKNDIYIAFNAKNDEKKVVLPNPPEGKAWHIIVDTSTPSPNDIFDESKAPLANLEKNCVPFSSLVLKAINI